MIATCHASVTRDTVTCHTGCHAPVTQSRPVPSRPVYTYRTSAVVSRCKFFNKTIPCTARRGGLDANRRATAGRLV